MPAIRLTPLFEIAMQLPRIPQLEDSVKPNWQLPWSVYLQSRVT